MEVIKSSRFWLALVALAVIGALAWAGKLSGEGAAGYLMSILAGFGVAKASGSSAKALLPFALVASLALSACGTTARGWLAKGHTAMEAVDKVALEKFGTKCLDEAVKCGKVPPASCPGWVKCDKARATYKVAMDAIDAQLALVNKVLSDLGVD